MLQGLTRILGWSVAAGLFSVSMAWAANPPAAKSGAGADDVAVLETTKGRMVIEFWEKDAPQTVANFKKLARQGFFDGTGFHRIIKGFMIQGGDPKSKNPKAPDLGTGDPGYKINDEFNSHKHVPGVLSMANSGTPNSAGSQFFIMDGPAPFLDGKYTAFGHVIDGMSVLKDIANTPVGPNTMMGGEKSKPLEWTTLKSVKIVPRSSVAKGSGGAAKSSASHAGMSAKPAADKAAAPEGAAAQTKPEEASSSAQQQGSGAAQTQPEGQGTAPDNSAPPDTSQGAH